MADGFQIATIMGIHALYLAINIATFGKGILMSRRLEINGW